MITVRINDSQGELVKELQLPEGTHTIGRVPENTIPLRDMKVSRKHAELIVSGNQCVVKDTQSTSGVFLNNERVMESELKDGDILHIGDMELHISFEDADGGTKVGSSQIGRLRVIAPAEAAGDIYLEKTETVLGRVPECDIQVLDKEASREHAKVILRNNSYFVQDLESANGTLLNDQKITQQPLVEGDIIAIGKFRYKFSICNKEAAKRTSQGGSSGIVAPKTVRVPVSLAKKKSSPFKKIAAVLAILVIGGACYVLGNDELKKKFGVDTLLASFENKTKNNTPENNTGNNTPENNTGNNTPENNNGNGSVEDPVDDTGVEDPVDDTGVEDPVDDTGIEDPVDDTGIEDPVDDTGIEDPVDDTGIEDPVDDTGIEDPVDDTGTEDPVDDTGSGSANLEITFADVEKVEFGKTAKYTVTVTNSGDAEAQNVALKIQIPNGLKASEGSWINKSLGTIAAGENKTFSYTLTGFATGQHTQKAMLSVNGESAGEATTSTNVWKSSAPAGKFAIDLQVAGEDTITYKQQGVWKVVVKNTGNAPAKAVTVIIKLGANASYKGSIGKSLSKSVASLEANGKIELAVPYEGAKIGKTKHLIGVKVGSKVVALKKLLVDVQKPKTVEKPVEKPSTGGQSFPGAPSAAEIAKIEADKKKRWEIDFSKVLGITKEGKCKNCHAEAVKAWENTHHYKTYQELHKRKNAKTIIKKMGLKGSIRKQEICMQCHYTRQADGGDLKAVSGISCESCHGPASDWQYVHNNYGGATKQTESAAHRLKRWADAENAGMLRPGNIYAVAENCYNCHTVPNEKLVNVGGHHAGSKTFELVSWSQGEVRHNYMTTKVNDESPIERRRVMFVIGAMLNLEYGLRGIAKATQDGNYFRAMKLRLTEAIKTLSAIKAKAPVSQIDILFKILGGVKLNPNQEKELLQASYNVAWAAQQFAKEHDGSKLSGVDGLIPKKYQGTPTK